MLQSIINAHDVKNGDTLWDLSSVFYTRNLKTEMVFCVPFSQSEDDDFTGTYMHKHPKKRKNKAEKDRNGIHNPLSRVQTLG